MTEASLSQGVPVMACLDPRAPAPKRIAIFRALQLGDLLCTVPAMRALRRAYPAAHICLVGLPGARGFVTRFAPYLDELMVFPGIRQFPEQVADESALPDFFKAARARRFDLAIQMHGSGSYANEITSALGAAQWGGFVPDCARQETGRFLAWPDHLPEPLRYLALLAHMGLADSGDGSPEFPLYDEDVSSAAKLLEQHRLDPARTVVIHPGARLPSRRWPAQRFGDVARALAQEGWPVAVTGTPDEAQLTRAVAAKGAEACVDLCGQTSLGTLAALIQRCRLLICNDTGVSHVAAGVRAPSVVVASGSDVRRWAPLDQVRHEVLWAPAPCRPCSHHECPIGHPCALAVSVDAVLERVWLRLESRTFKEAMA